MQAGLYVGFLEDQEILFDYLAGAGVAAGAAAGFGAGVAAGFASGFAAGAGAAVVVGAAAGAIEDTFIGVFTAKLAQMLMTQMKMASPQVAFSMKSVVLR